MEPIANPPSILTKTIISDAIASPLTNFIAPSIEPYSLLSRWMLLRCIFASSSVREPARTSASMLSCFPGIASRENLALTSATLSAPFVITMNCTIVSIRNITSPTTRFPPTTNSPKVCIISPASACSRINLVVLMDRASRNRVVISKTAGNAAKSRGAAK